MSVAWPDRAFIADTQALVAWRRQGAALAATLVSLLALFHADVAALTTIWWTNTTYGHCLFVLPVVGWLIWQRRAELAQLTPTGWLPGLAVVAAGAFGWLLGDAASVALVCQAGLLLMIWGAVAALLGPNVMRGLAFPLAWLAFAIPFGQELEPPLQAITAKVSVALLHGFSVPATLDGVLIRTPAGFFEVAEACSGSKFLLAMLAFGTLVANVCFVSWRRRLAFMATAVVVPVVANAIRAFGTMYAAHLTSVEAATGFDHIVFGWVFFGLVMAAVLALGWKWFDRAPDDPMIDPAQLQRPVRWLVKLPVAVGGTLALAVAVFVCAAALAQRADDLPDHPKLPDVPGWTRAPLSTAAPWAPNYPTADHLLMQRYIDGRGHAVDLAVALYAGQHDGKELVTFGQGAIRENDSWVRIENLPAIDGAQVLRMTAPGSGGAAVERTVATWYRVGGITTGSDRVAKLSEVYTKFTGLRQAGVAVMLSAEGEQRAARGAIASFRAALGDPGVLADRLSSR